MPINPEQEFKTLLTKEQAEAIKRAYPFDSSFTQTNRYFDTEDSMLKAADCGLRIRNFSDRSEQTLKVPAGPNRALIEYTDPLPVGESALKGGGEVESKLLELGVSLAALRPFATLTTSRALHRTKEGLLTLDHSTFSNGKSDWELELEHTNRQGAATFWKQLMKRFAIAPNPPQNKVARAVANNVRAI